MSESARISVVGASGYTGGEALRLLLAHPCVTVGQVTSESNAGNYVYSIHPNLRKATTLQFVSARALEPADVIFLALPHGEAQKQIAHFAELAPIIVDLSADFRLRDEAIYQRYYGEAHGAPDWIGRFVYGLPEINREALRGARYASGVRLQCDHINIGSAAAGACWIDRSVAPIMVDVKVGSSEAGASASPSSHHPERSGVVRTFAATGHRHEAEIAQNLGRDGVYLSISSVEMVRGVMATAQAFALPGVDEKVLWKAYRAAYSAEPFVRIVHDKSGLHRHPEPKFLAGTNYADVGWEFEPETGRIVALAAIDNLGKGAAGSAMQCLNLMMGWDETAGLTFTGLHPI